MELNLQLDAELYRRAEAEAAKQGISLTRFVEEAIRERLNRATFVARPVSLPVATATGGLAPGFSSLREAVEAADLCQKCESLLSE